MADDRKTRAERNARRVAEWLADHRTDFEERGVADHQLAGVGLTDNDLAEALDHLENREEVVRFPNSLLKPGRGWAELRAGIVGKAPNAAAGPSAPELRA